MSTIETTERPIPLRLKVIHYVRLGLSIVARFFFGLYYGKEGQKIPPIIDDILKQPAVEVAKKIRNKEVCINCFNKTNNIVPTYILNRISK